MKSLIKTFLFVFVLLFSSTQAQASVFATFVTTLYDYDNLFSDEIPPWADFPIVTEVYENKLVPGVKYSLNF